MKIWNTVFILLFAFQLTCAQNQDSTITIAAGKEYKTGWLHNIFFGSHWRDVWAVPVRVKVLNLENFAGGITPIKRGGGFQTKSLRFKGNDGHYWKFRSIPKDPSKTLPDNLQESLAEDIIQDQISSANPYAPFVVAPILDSLHVLQAKPHLYYLPDSEKLGEFREEFGDMYGIMEIHPDVKTEENIYFEDANKIKGTLDLFERLEKERDEKVNSTEYLKARLLDLFLGDWDRHADQWKWARKNKDGAKLWYPIPRDRDQTFAKFDGLLVKLAAYIIPQFNDFDYSFQKVKYLTWNGRFVDRHFLTEITKTEWDSVANYVQEKLTDDLIEDAVDKFPPEIYPLVAEEVKSKLKARCDLLIELSNEYYEFVNTVVDIYCSGKNDFVEINRMDNKRTSVKVYRKDKTTAEKKGEPTYNKTFDNDITDEIRVFLLKGDDKVVLTGTVDDGVMIRIIGGQGTDEIIDSSDVKGYFLGITPIPDSENKTKVYDHSDVTKITFGPGTTIDRKKVEKPKTQEEKYRPLQKNRSSETYICPAINYSSDNGFMIGGGPLYYNYGFRAVPNEFEFLLKAYYATKPKHVAVHLETQFHNVIDNGILKFDLDATGLEFTKYHGYGNETKFDAGLENAGYYKLEEGVFAIRSALEFKLSKFLKLQTGVAYKYSDSYLENKSLLINFPYGNYGTGILNLLNTNIAFKIDTRDNKHNTHSGIYAKFSGDYYPKMLDNKSQFGKGLFDVRGFATTNYVTETTFAFRAFGEKVWGRFPFRASAFLGGRQNLLSYSRERFAGSGSLYGSLQMRMKLINLRLLINGKLGFHLFGESGRVFTQHDVSKKWHSGFGGGLWISYLDRIFNLVFTYARSNEIDRIYFGFGFNF